MTEPERRYLYDSKVAHLVTPNLWEPDTLMTPCGLSANSYFWRGTGSQDEYDKLATLPTCRRCLR